MNGKPIEIPSLDSLVADPGRAATLPPDVAQALLIRLVSLQPILMQRALMCQNNREGEVALLTIKEVAQRLNVSEYRVYELARHGILKSVRLGRSVRVRPSAVTEYLAQSGA